MRRFVSAGLALSAITLALGATTAAQAQLINGFEAPVQGAPGYTYNTVGNAATFTGLSGISGNGSAFTSGNPAAPQGTQVAFLQNLGSFSQTLSISGPYSFSFQAAQRQNFQIGGAQSFSVSLNGTLLGTFTPTGTTYQTFNIGVTTVAAGSTITFAGLVAPAAGDRTVFVDNIVATTAAPEPGSALLLIPGLLGMAAVVRRRRK
jgi:hypothetical protein